MQVKRDFIERVEANWQFLAGAVVQDLHGDEKTSHYHGLASQDLIDRARRLVHHLEDWLLHPDPLKVRRFFEPVGVRRYEQQVPLAQVKRKVLLLERRLVALARTRTPIPTSAERDAEAELLQSMREYFTEVTAAISSGYHAAAKKAA